jgi:hypothetical protein
MTNIAPPSETPATPSVPADSPPAAPRGPPEPSNATPSAPTPQGSGASAGRGMVQAIEQLQCNDTGANATSSSPNASEPGAATPPATATPASEEPIANRPLGGEPPPPRTPAEVALGGQGFDAPLGTSPRVGDFTGLAGKSIPEILARIPSNAQVRELTPVEGASQAGREYKWNDGTSTWRVRIHDPDPSAPQGTNAHDGWVVRVQRGKQYMDSDGNFFHAQSHNPKSPNYNPDAANATHIPVAGNPHAPAQ